MDPNERMEGRIASVQVGMPREHGTEGAADPMDRPWVTGFFKAPVAGPVRVGATSLEGDGDALTLVERPNPEWTVELALELLRPGNGREAEAAALARVPALAESWRPVIQYRLAHGDIGSDEARLVGPNG